MEPYESTEMYNELWSYINMKVIKKLNIHDVELNCKRSIQ